MDTKFHHIGNMLVDATEEELNIVLNQYMNKMKVSKEWMLNYFSKVIDCKSFYYDGSMKEEIEEDYEYKSN